MSKSIKPKILFRKIYSDFFYYSGMSGAIKLLGKNKTIILGYHRILPRDSKQIEFIQPGMYVTTETFEKHISYLSRHFDIIPLGSLASTPHVQNGCIITFDDGWADNYKYAYPIIKRYGIPATVFISTNMMGSSQWPWPDRLSYYIYYGSSNDLFEISKIIESDLGKNITGIENLLSKDKHLVAEQFILAIKSLDYKKITFVMERVDSIMLPLYKSINTNRPWLTWGEIKEMAENNVSFGSHTHNHVVLTTTSLENAEKEIIKSRDILSKELGKPVEMFSYPNGNYNNEIMQILKRNGFKIAVTTEKGTIKKIANLLALRRFMIHDDMTSTIPMLACKITRVSPFL